MGRNWRPYNVGPYQLGTLLDAATGRHEAVVRYRDEDGTPRRRRLGVFSENEGRAALDQWVSLRGAVKEVLDTPRVEDLWLLYIEDRRKDGKKMQPFHESWGALKHRFAGMRVSAITDDVCRNYAEERIERGRIIRKKDGTERRVPVSVGTAWTELLRLRSMVNWAVSRGHLKRQQHIWVPPKPDPRDIILEPDEFQALMDHCHELHTKLFCMIAITTAARSAAILELEWSRVNYRDRTLDFRTPLVRENLLSKASRKRRVIGAMTNEVEILLIEAQRKWGDATSHVIAYDFKQVKCIRKSFMAAAARAGLPPSITPHILRHTALTWLDEAGIPVERISRLAGHSRSSITEQIYIKTRMAQIRGASETLGRIVADAGNKRRLQHIEMPPEDAN